MSLSVNRIENISYRVGGAEIEEKKTPAASEKAGLSDSEKITIGLGALAAAAIGGILIKRRIDTKAAEKLAQKAAELLQKPKEFSYENMHVLADEWAKSGKIKDGDEVILICKTMLDELAKNPKNEINGWPKLFYAMKMSDNGFAVVVRKSDGSIDSATLKYFDPLKIIEPKIKNAIREHKLIILPVKDAE